MINLIFPTSIDSGEHDEINGLKIPKSTKTLQKWNLLFSTSSLEKNRTVNSFLKFSQHQRMYILKINAKFT